MLRMPFCSSASSFGERVGIVAKSSTKIGSRRRMACSNTEPW